MSNTQSKMKELIDMKAGLEPDYFELKNERVELYCFPSRLWINTNIVPLYTTTARTYAFETDEEFWSWIAWMRSKGFH
jgi:hypothetical protein